MVGQPRVPEPIVLEDNQAAQEFEVAQLLAKRQVRGRGVQYLVRWKGYGPHEDTWEPLENLTNAKRLVRDFERKAQRTLV